MGNGLKCAALMGVPIWHPLFFFMKASAPSADGYSAALTGLLRFAVRQAELAWSIRALATACRTPHRLAATYNLQLE